MQSYYVCMYIEKQVKQNDEEAEDLECWNEHARNIEELAIWKTISIEKFLQINRSNAVFAIRKLLFSSWCFRNAIFRLGCNGDA